MSFSCWEEEKSYSLDDLSHDHHACGERVVDQPGGMIQTPGNVYTSKEFIGSAEKTEQNEKKSIALSFFSSLAFFPRPYSGVKMAEGIKESSPLFCPPPPCVKRYHFFSSSSSPPFCPTLFMSSVSPVRPFHGLFFCLCTRTGNGDPRHESLHPKIPAWVA